MNKEYHIIIFWEKALPFLELLNRQVEQALKVIYRVRYEWDSKFPNQNYASFYGEKLQDIQYKTDHCGAGSFLVLIVEDSDPIYEKRSTSSGERTVNKNMFDLKSKLRELTGGGHLVHASDSREEADLNSISLFGKKLEPFLLEVSVGESEESTVRRNITGALGWNSWGEMFSVLDANTDYVVLRNYDFLVNNAHGEHGDVDLLVRDRLIAETIIGGQKAAMGKERVLYEVTVAGKTEEVDIRYRGDGYYCDNFEDAILNNKIRHEKGRFFIPNKEDEKLAILYHAIVQKPFLASDYKEYLTENYKTIERGALRKELDTIMAARGFEYTKPSDASVYIHPDYYHKIKLPNGTKIYNYLKFIKYKVVRSNGRKSKLGSKIYKILVDKYYMVKQFLRKVKATISK